MDRKKYYAEWRERKKQEGLCQTCGIRPTDKLWTQCKECRLLIAEQTKKRKQKLKSAGLCIECGNPTETKTTRCRKCLDLMNKKIKARRQKLLEAGICIFCTKMKSIKKKRYCEDCYLKILARKYLGDKKKWQKLKQLFESQKKCPYSGKNLVLGDNTSLDHRIATARGGSIKIHNLQFVYAEGHVNINKMKLTMTEEEFKEAIKLIYDNFVNIPNQIARPQSIPQEESR